MRLESRQATTTSYMLYQPQASSWSGHTLYMDCKPWRGRVEIRSWTVSDTKDFVLCEIGEAVIGKDEWNAPHGPRLS